MAEASCSPLRVPTQVNNFVLLGHKFIEVTTSYIQGTQQLDALGTGPSVLLSGRRRYDKKISDCHSICIDDTKREAGGREIRMFGVSVIPE